MAAAYTRRRRMQICAGNRLARRPEIIEQMQQLGYTVEFEECLDQCLRCPGCAFALVCGHFVYAASPEELLEKLK